MLTNVFLVISGLFVAGLVAKHFARRQFCVLCASIGLTWLGLFILYKLNRFHDTVLLSLLMGQSITGLYYFVKKRVNKILRLFTLPFFLTLTGIFYMLITREVIIGAFGLLLVLWLMAWIAFTYRSDPGKKNIAKILAECCEDT